MGVGLSAYDMEAADLVELARAADELGFESLWLGEHVDAPADYGSEHPSRGTAAGRPPARPIVEAATRLVDPIVAIAGCGTVTRHIRLATGIFLAALRPPLVTARMAHTAQQLCGGRFQLGVGAGWLREEYAAVGVPWERRGARLAETVQVMRRAWQGRPFSHHGEFFTVGEVQLCDQPVDVPVIMGGNSDAALRRAAAMADGWMASGTPELEDACRLRDRLLEHLSEAGGRPAIPMHTRLAQPEPALAQAYQRRGWEHIVVWAHQVWPADAPLEEKRAALAAVARTLGVPAGPPSTPRPAEVKESPC